MGMGMVPPSIYRTRLTGKRLPRRFTDTHDRLVVQEDHAGPDIKFFSR